MVNLARRIVSIVALASGLALVASINGLASVSALALVSSESQVLSTCSNDSQRGKNYLSGEEEPQLAISKTGQMVAMWHQDRWSNGGAHGIGVGFSSNGSSWGHTLLPDDMCTTAPNDPLHIYQRSSDPWVSFGPDGTAYASALSFDSTDNKNAVVAGISTDGGAHWQVSAIPGSVFTTTQFSTDKNATTADPTRPGTAYTVWDTLVLATDQPDDNPHTQAYTGPAYFSKTTIDQHGNVSQSPAKIIIDTANRQQTIGNVIVVDPRDGTLYDFTDLIISPNTPFRGAHSNAQLAFVKSTNGGDTWTQPQIIAPFNSLGVHDPNTGQLLRVGDGLEEVAIDARGKLYAVWESSTNFIKNVQQSAGLWDDEVLFTTSSNGGVTWSDPTVVEKLDSGLPTYTPTIAVNGSTLAVTYFDNRNLHPGQTANLPTDYWVKFSVDGGQHWVNEQRITPNSFDQLSAPFARGFFLGDYEGLQPSGSGFEAVFVKTNCNATNTEATTFTGQCGPASNSVAPNTTNTNPTDVFAAAIS